MTTHFPWLEQYTHYVPDTIDPDVFTSLVHLFEADDFSDRPVFTSFGVSITYSK
jgi:long-chain acyl-CoA synthetase